MVSKSLKSWAASRGSHPDKHAVPSAGVGPLLNKYTCKAVVANKTEPQIHRASFQGYTRPGPTHGASH